MCPMERHGAGNNGESRRASRKRAGHRPAWSGRVRVRDLPNRCSEPVASGFTGPWRLRCPTLTASGGGLPVHSAGTAVEAHPTTGGPAGPGGRVAQLLRSKAPYLAGSGPLVGCSRWLLGDRHRRLGRCGHVLAVALVGGGEGDVTRFARAFRERELARRRGDGEGADRSTGRVFRVRAGHFHRRRRLGRAPLPTAVR